MPMRGGAGRVEDRAILQRDHARREVEHPIRGYGLAQCDPAQEGTFDWSFGRLDVRPRPLVEVTDASTQTRSFAAALQAAGCGVLYEKEPARGEGCALPKAIPIG